MTFLRDLHFQWQKFLESSDIKGMKTTSRDHSTSLYQLHLNMSTSFGKTSYPDEFPATTTFGKLQQGEVPLTMKNLGFVSRLKLLTWNCHLLLLCSHLPD